MTDLRYCLRGGCKFATVIKRRHIAMKGVTKDPPRYDCRFSEVVIDDTGKCADYEPIKDKE